MSKIDPAPNRLVAVYGTLKQGFGLHDTLRPYTFKGNMWLKNYIMLSLGAYPAAVPYEGYDALAEVYEITPETLRTLDQVEGVDSDLYRRQTVVTQWGPAEVYYMPGTRLRENDRIVSSGVWLGPASPCNVWLGTLAEKDMLARGLPACRILSHRHPSGQLDVMALDSLRRAANLPSNLGQPYRKPTVYLPPPAVVKEEWPEIDVAASCGPGLEEAV